MTEQSVPPPGLALPTAALPAPPAVSPPADREPAAIGATLTGLPLSLQGVFLGIAVILAGCIGPWVSVGDGSLVGGQASRRGLAFTDGKMIVAAALGAGFVAWRSHRSGETVFPWLASVLGVFCAAGGALELHQVKSSFDALDGGGPALTKLVGSFLHIGWGLYVVIAGGLIVALSGYGLTRRSSD
jgi:hypothetical protein